MTQTTHGPDTAGVTWNDVAHASAHLEAERAHPPRKYDELLPVTLSESELADRARKAAGARHRVAEYEAQKKTAVDNWKAKIELAENERDELLDVIASGIEERHIEVLETFDFRLGSVTVTRTDTGEKIRERAMSSHERQRELFDVSGRPREQLELESGPVAHDGDEPADDDEVTDPEAVLEGDVPAAPTPKTVIRRGKKA